MRKVFKYELPVDDYFTLSLPKGAQVLSVQAQGNKPCLWALVDPDAPTEERQFRFAGTGHSIKEDPGRLEFVSTFQTHGGSLVFHIFEVLSDDAFLRKTLSRFL